MKFTCIKDNLEKGLFVVGNISGKNVSLPVLNNILIEAATEGITLSATNLEVGIKTKVRGKVEQGGKVTIPARLISEYVHLIKGETVDMELDGTILRMKSGKNKTKVNTLPADEYPLIPFPSSGEEGKVKVGELKDALQSIIFSVSRDEVRQELTGVLFTFTTDTLILAATDSYRLAEKRISFQNISFQERSVIVPARVLHEIIRSAPEGDASIVFSEDQFLVSVEGVHFVSRLIEGNYPDYTQIIPKQTEVSLQVEQDHFLDALKVAGLFTRSGVNDITLTFYPQKKIMEVVTSNSQVGENVTNIDIDPKKGEGRVVFNWRYLMEGLQAIKTDKVIFEIAPQGGPGVLRPVGDNSYLYLVMPIKQ